MNLIKNPTSLNGKQIVETVFVKNRKGFEEGFQLTFSDGTFCRIDSTSEGQLVALLFNEDGSLVNEKIYGQG